MARIRFFKPTALVLFMKPCSREKERKEGEGDHEDLLLTSAISAHLVEFAGRTPVTYSFVGRTSRSSFCVGGPDLSGPRRPEVVLSIPPPPSYPFVAHSGYFILRVFARRRTDDKQTKLPFLYPFLSTSAPLSLSFSLSFYLFVPTSLSLFFSGSFAHWRAPLARRRAQSSSRAKARR